MNFGPIYILNIYICFCYQHFFLGMSTVYSIFSIVIIHICMSLFESTPVKMGSSNTFFLSLLPWRSVGRSNFDCSFKKFNNIDSNNDIGI